MEKVRIGMTDSTFFYVSSKMNIFIPSHESFLSCKKFWISFSKFNQTSAFPPGSVTTVVEEDAHAAGHHQAHVLPRTVNGTGHTGPSEFCATSI